MKKDKWFSINFNEKIESFPEYISMLYSVLSALDIKINKERYQELPNWAKKYWKLEEEK